MTDRGGNDDIAIVPADGGAVRLLMETAGDENSPRLTPDGSTMVYVAEPLNKVLVTVKVASLLRQP